MAHRLGRRLGSLLLAGVVSSLAMGACISPPEAADDSVASQTGVASDEAATDAETGLLPPADGNDEQPSADIPEEGADESLARPHPDFASMTALDAAPASPSIGAFAVYATEALEMNSGALVTGCSVGVESTTGPFLSGNAAASFNSGAKIQSSQTLYAYSIYLNSGVSLGPVDTDHVLGNSGATYGPVAAFPAMPAPPPLPAATAGTTAVTLNSGVTKTIAPGAFGAVTVNSGATLTLTGGAYVFSSLAMNSGGTLIVDKASTIAVTGMASFGSGSFLGPAASSGLTAKGLVLDLESSCGFSFNSGAQIQALVVATNAEVTINTAKFVGAIAAKQIVMNSGATVTCQDSFGGPACSGCFIGGVCVAAGTTNGANTCETCQPSVSTSAYSNVTNGTSCSDGNACTQTDACESGACTGSNPVTCTAPDSCHTAGTCNTSTGVCSAPTLNAGFCSIGGACVSSGATNGTNTCETCQPSVTTSAYSNVANGTSCSDGNACDLSDSCQAGTCTAGSHVTCSAPDACHTAGTCNATTGACSAPALNAGFCSIGGACIPAGATNGANTCETCQPSVSTSAYTNVANGTSCSDGNACTQTDACQSGACVGANPVTCTAPDSCHTAGTCNATTGACSTPTLNSGFCAIGGACVAAGATNGANTCETCQPAVSTSAYTNASNGTACNDGNACTQTDTCQSGSCTGANTVTCTASDQCHGAGTCNTSNGQCSNPTLTDGTTCNDGNACTQTDTCVSGACTGASPVTCTASDQCHVAGTCSASTGLCSNPTAANGTACNDGNACTQTDQCQTGMCAGTNPVTCVAADQCHVPGTCDPTSGACSSPAASDGTMCTDGNACTQTDVCATGVCIGTSPVKCSPFDACHVAGTCDPTSGACSNPAAADGTTCGDAALCAQAPVCSSGVCASGAPFPSGASCPSGACDGNGSCAPVPDAGSNPTDASLDASADEDADLDGGDGGDADAATSSIGTGSSSGAGSSGGGSSGGGLSSSGGASGSGGESSSSGGSSGATGSSGGGASGSGGAGSSSGSSGSGGTACSPAGCDDANPCTIDSCDSNGACTHSPGIDGTACNGGAGACVGATCVTALGSSPVAKTCASCVALDQCHGAGTCDTTTGQCTAPLAADGTACNDGNDCTQGDTCVAGSCTGGPSLACTAGGLAGTCDPSTGACSPPPEAQCQALDQTVATTMAQATACLYTGANPPQIGVLAGTIVAKQAAALRGRVFDPSGNPLPGVTIAVLNHTEFGITTTTADGSFTMAVNGGQSLTVTYSIPGFLHVQRTLATVAWNNYAIVPDVVMTKLDSAATLVNLSGTQSSFQTVRATTVTDSSGTRTATLFIPPNATASLVSATGSTNAPSLTFRATEYTVGEFGPSAMPGTLPATSGYTYAVELSADEALAVGASVAFSAPVFSYTDNFLNFSVGERVPAGYFNEGTGQWIASPDGLVIGILRVANGLAQLDLNGDGTAETASQLASAGITPAEQAQIALTYPTPTSVWRVPIPHFTAWDFNWPFAPPPGSTPPDPPSPPGPPPTPADTCKSDTDGTQNGSEIDCQNGVLHESIPLSGTPYTLNYTSQRANGFAPPNRLLIPLTGATLPSQLASVSLEVDVAGRSFISSFPAVANESTVFDWDGYDVFGRAVQGTQIATIQIGYVYPGTYLTPSQNPNGAAYDALFGHFSYYGTPATGDLTRQQVTLWNVSSAPIGRTWNALPAGLGGWTLSAQNTYDLQTSTLALGTGEQRSLGQFGPIITTTAGLAPYSAGDTGDNGPAQTAQFDTPAGLTVGPDGTIYVADYGNNRVRTVTPNGIVQTIAGSGAGFSHSRNFGGNGGPATQARLSAPASVAVGTDGSVYISDSWNYLIRKVSPEGIISTFAGNGTFGTVGTGDGGPATSAALGAPGSLTLGPDGSLYFVDYFCVRKVDPRGIISTVAGVCGKDSFSGFTGDGLTATSTYLGGDLFGTDEGIGNLIAVDANGILYIADANSLRLRAVGTDGIMRTVAGNGTLGCNYGTAVDTVCTCVGGQCDPTSSATQRSASPIAVAVGPDGTIYYVDVPMIGFNSTIAIHALSSGQVTTIAGTAPASYGSSADGVPASTAAILGSVGDIETGMGLAVSPDGEYLYFSQSDQIRQIGLWKSGFTDAAFSVASQDASAVYGFDPFGRHLVTQALPTGAATATFSYDSSGRLTGIADVSGNITTVERGSSGVPLSITSPYGLVTTLAIGADGYLASVSDPTGALYQMSYEDGLLTSIQFPTGSPTSRSSKTYDSLGRVTTSTDAAGHSWTFQRGPDSTGNISVTKTSALGVSTSYAVTLQSSGGTGWTNTLSDGTVSTHQVSASGSVTSTNPNGTTTAYTPGPDPRFGMQAPIIASKVITTPSGLAQTTATARTVTLTDPTNPLSLATETDTRTVNGNTWTTSFNVAKGTFTTTSPVGRVSSRAVNAAGMTVQTTVGEMSPTVLSYDARGRLQTSTQGSFAQGGVQVPRTSTLAYDAYGYLSETVDPLGVAAAYLNDARGLPLQTTFTDGMGGQRVYQNTYDGDGNMTSETMPGGAIHGFAYTPVDGLAAYIPPGFVPGSDVVDLYNADGQVSEELRSDGATIAYQYDAAGRRVTTTYPQATVTRGYSATTGQLVNLTSSSGENLALAYDGNLLTKQTWSGNVNGSLVLGYDAKFRQSSEAVGTTTVAFSYDNDDLLTQAGAISISRDAQNGRVTGTALGNLLDNYTYDANGALTSYVVTYNGSAIYAESISSRDGNGRILARTETAGTSTHVWSYRYDSAGRLVSATEDGATLSQYSYDVDDNRATRMQAQGTLSAVYDAQDRLLSYGETSYTFGPGGDLQAKFNAGSATEYEYDAFGNLLTVELPGGTTIGYIVDEKSRRVGKTVGGVVTKGFLYDNELHIVAQLDGGGNIVSRFVFGSKANVPDYFVSEAGTFRILSDHLGSPRMVVNVTDGTVAEEIDYDEFGNVVDDTQPGLIPFGFAGGQYDSDTALLRFGARDYDPSVGRWTARDPLKFRGSPLNLYDYAQGDPVNYVDLDGQGVVAGLAVGLACAAYDTYQAVQTLNQLNALQAQLTALQTQRLRDLQTSCDADNAAGAYGEENELEAQIYSLTLAYARTQNNGAFSTAETSAACLILAGVATLLPTP